MIIVQPLYLERNQSKAKRLKTCDAIILWMSALHTEEGAAYGPRSSAVVLMFIDIGVHVELSSSLFQRAVSIKQILSEEGKNPIKIKALTIRLGRFYSFAEVF